MLAKMMVSIAFYFLYWFCCFLGTGTDRKNLAGLRSYPDAVQQAVRQHPVLGKAAPQQKSIGSILFGNGLLFTAAFSVLGLTLKNILGLDGGDGRVGLADVEYLLQNRKNVLTMLSGDGDFRSPECVELLNEADVVVTNPPFSLFRDYMELLEECHKKYIIIGNMNAVTYKEIFPLIAQNKLCLFPRNGTGGV